MAKRDSTKAKIDDHRSKWVWEVGDVIIIRGDDEKLQTKKNLQTAPPVSTIAIDDPTLTTGKADKPNNR